MTLWNIEGIVGGSGDDALISDDAGHLLAGGDGNDNLTGGAGNDTLMGGSGINSLTGGVGADAFVFGPEDLGSTDWMDFNPDDGDKIDLHAFGLTAAPTVTQDTDFLGQAFLSVDLHNDGSQILTIDLGQSVNGDPDTWMVI